jgi:hypothetical protein
MKKEILTNVEFILHMISGTSRFSLTSFHISTWSRHVELFEDLVTSHTSEMASNRNTSHAEIWDDSLLVNSWNEALEEYKVGGSSHDACGS